MSAMAELHYEMSLEGPACPESPEEYYFGSSARPANAEIAESEVDDYPHIDIYADLSDALDDICFAWESMEQESLRMAA